jgi:hypothetical protein
LAGSRFWPAAEDVSRPRRRAFPPAPRADYRRAVSPDDALLEVGCATGKATLPLARRGLRITCLEIGEGLPPGYTWTRPGGRAERGF